MNSATGNADRYSFASYIRSVKPAPRRSHPAGNPLRRLPCPSAPDPNPETLPAGDPSRPLARMASRYHRATPASPTNVRWSTGGRGGGKYSRINPSAPSAAVPRGRAGRGWQTFSDYTGRSGPVHLRLVSGEPRKERIAVFPVKSGKPFRSRVVC